MYEILQAESRGKWKICWICTLCTKVQYVAQSGDLMLQVIGWYELILWQDK